MSFFQRASSFLALAASLLLISTPQSWSDQELTDSQVDRALEAIWLKTPAPEKRSPDSAKRAALEAYLTRLGPGTEILTTPEKPGDLPPAVPFAPLQFHSEVVTPNTGYVRLGAFIEDLPARLDPVLRDFVQIGVRNVILDLRATPAQGNLALAGEVSGCFLPEGTQAFQIRSSNSALETVRTKKKPVSQFKLLVLTGERTAGPVEALAAALRAHGGALLLGVSTQGQAADFELVPLGKDRFLRLPIREALVSGAPALVPDGVHPDIICNATPEATDAALLKEAQEGRVTSILKETERPRLNEAALVAGTNPETEAWIQTQLRRNQPKPAPLPKDAALSMALDFLVGWEALYGRALALP
jgi:Peptidase family S41